MFCAVSHGFLDRIRPARPAKMSFDSCVDRLFPTLPMGRDGGSSGAAALGVANACSLSGLAISSTTTIKFRCVVEDVESTITDLRASPTVCNERVLQRWCAVLTVVKFCKVVFCR